MRFHLETGHRNRGVELLPNAEERGVELLRKERELIDMR